MPDWKEEIRARLSGLRLQPTREAEIVEELAQHLDDLYEESLQGGASKEEAYQTALLDKSADLIAVPWPVFHQGEDQQLGTALLQLAVENA